MDPAGPRFVDGPGDNPFDGPAIPDLAENILSKVKFWDYNVFHIHLIQESAAFVDVIHTNGASKPCVYCITCKFVKIIF